MEATAPVLKLPQTLDELDEGILLRIPASWEEYLDLVDKTPYTIQFLDNEILIMGQATDTHEQLVARLIKLFANYFDELDTEYRVLGSNVKLVIPEQKGDFNADLSVVRGQSEYGTTQAGKDSKVRIKNPEIVVEVLSKGSRMFDLGGKLITYHRILSLQHILLVNQETVDVHVSSRTDQPNQWLTTRYSDLTHTVLMGDFSLSLADIYRKIELAGD